MKKSYVVVIIALTLLIFGTYLASQDHQNRYAKYIKDNTPSKIKNFLKNTLFYLPIKIRNASNTEKLYLEAELENKKLKKENKILINKLNLGKYEKKNINNKYLAESIIIPYDIEKKFENIKPNGYLEVFENKLIVVYVSGEIIYFNKNIFNDKKNEYTKIKTNLIKDKLFDGSIVWTGIKDTKVINNKIYISLTQEIKPNCYNTSLFSAEVNLIYLDFKEVFKSSECAIIEKRIEYFKYFNGHQNGGRIEYLNKKIYLTIGDYNNWEFPQDENSDFGKILEIDPKNNEYRYISMGHRNQQGLDIFSNDNNTLISTEHGPKGGDEINIIKLDKNLNQNNYGWPIASYGDHYDIIPINSHTKRYAPLNKNHNNYGFVEPLFYFKKSIGISEIEKNFFKKNQFFVTSLKEKKIYVFEIKNDVFNLVEEIYIGERIRDIIYDFDEKAYFLYLENSPKLLKLSNLN